MQKRITINDVADHAGVSKSTVSLVLQNSPRIREETTERVKQSIEALGYVYNRAAARLRGATTGQIGLVVNDLRNPFFTEFAIAAQMALSEAGFVTVIANSDEDPEIQAKVIKSMIEHDVSAFIVSPAIGSPSDALEFICEHDIPTLQVLRQIEGSRSKHTHFSFDHKQGGVLATKHLLDNGCRTIAFLGGYSNLSVTKDRMQGYLETMQASGLDPIYQHGRPTRHFGRQYAQTLCETVPNLDALYCFNDLVALGSMDYLRTDGAEKFSHVQVVGFDDIEEARLTTPGLTTIRCDIAGFGRCAADIVGGWLNGSNQDTVIPNWDVELIARGTTFKR